MHGEHDALPVVASNGDSSLFIAATLAALVLAGSALVYRKTYEQPPQPGTLAQPFPQSTPDGIDTEKQPLDDHISTVGSSSSHDPDSKESKSSRSKDRRRRGKDPLKEILKGGKKIKSTATTPIKQSFTGKPILGGDDNRHHLNNLNNIQSPSTPASFTPNGTPNSFSRASGKRAQQDDSLVNLPATSSSVHSRSTSEVSHSIMPEQPHPHQHSHHRTASPASNSEDTVLTPSQSSSSFSSHNGREDNTNISEERDPDILSRHTHETPTAPSIFSTIQNNDGLNEVVNHSIPSYSSSASSTTNTTTASCVITPATSPSLSYTSSKLVPAPSPVEDNSDFANNGYASDCAPKNSPVSKPSHGLDTATRSKNISRKQRPLQSPAPPESEAKTKTNPREWEDTISAPSSSSSSPVAALVAPTSLVTAPAFPPDLVYRKPPRLQSKSLWSHGLNVKNGASSIHSSVSHPSLLSPTSGTTNSVLLSPSLSSHFEKGPSRVSKVVEEREGGESEGERDTADDSYAQLEFPTLNPTVSTPSSLASNGNGSSIASSSAAGPSNNQRPTTPRRAQSSRRPSTPSGSTPPHSTASSASGSGSGSLQPAVSIQTQLASLRGALEAARLREEKHKAEMERSVKELEILRWENVNSRRGEAELQNHIRHLMHKLQMYTSLFTTVSPPLSQQTQGPLTSSAGLLNPGDGGPESGNGPTTTSSSGTQTVQNPAAAVVPGPAVSSPSLPMLPLNGLSSPVSANGVFPSLVPSMHAPSPYFPYPIPPPLHPHSVMPPPHHPMFAQQFHHMQQQFLQFQHQHHMQNQNQGQSPTQQLNLMSMLHPPSTTYQPHAASSSSSMASGSRSSSRLGTESAGSLSPDMNASPSPAPGAKRRSKTKTRTTNGYFGGRVGWDDTSDGWIIGGVSIDEGDERSHENQDEERGEDGNGDEDEGGFNELLADAIFKRPGSIGVRSGKKSKYAVLDREKERSKDGEIENEVLDAVEPLTFPSLSELGNVYNESHNQSSSPSPVAEPGPEVLGRQPPKSSPHQDIEIAVPQKGLEPYNSTQDQPSSNTISPNPDSERTPRREELEPNVTYLFNGFQQGGEGN